MPRGNQHDPWEKVKMLAKDLQPGLVKSRVLLLTGLPAEMDAEADQRVELPEGHGS